MQDRKLSMSTSTCCHVPRVVPDLFINVLIMLKVDCKKWEQKYEIVYDRQNLNTFFGEMNPSNIACVEIGSHVHEGRFSVYLFGLKE